MNSEHEAKAMDDLKVFGESEAVKILENYDRNYKLSSEVMKTKIVKVPGLASDNFDIVSNYISNVSGRIIGKEYVEYKGWKMGATIYTLEVPVDAKYSDNLEELLFRYCFYDYRYNKSDRFREVFSDN